MTRVLSISSSRADVGILAPVWRALAAEPNVKLEVMLTGMHMANDPAQNAGYIATMGIPGGIPVHAGGADLGGASGRSGSAAMAASVEATGALCAEIALDALMIIGDRLDMIPAALATLPFNIPLVHLAGGDLSEGAIDDRVRHALTKLSHMHCVSNLEAAQRICHMGEEPWRIAVTGATGLDTLLSASPMDAAAFRDEIGMPSIDGLRLVTVHAETNADDARAPLEAVLAALDATPAPTLFTAPNSDPGGAVMRERIKEFTAVRPWAVFRDTLGSRLYANAMRYAVVMVGNSSSGIVEAGLFGLNVINVGRRQEGRLSGANVHHCANDATAVERLLRELTTPATGRPVHSLYGDGHAAPRIARLLVSLPDRRRLLDKHFFDGDARFVAPWQEEAA